MNQNPVLPLPKNRSNQQHLQHFLHFVANPPNTEHAVIIIFNNPNSAPQTLLETYDTCMDYNPQQEDIFCALTQINKQNTTLFGLNKNFFNLKDQNQKTITSEHLMLLYILNKYPKVKFCFCFDKDTIRDSSFRSVKQVIQRLAFIINFGKIKKYTQSFMILLYQNAEDEIIEAAKSNLSRSIQEKDFYKENHQFANNIFRNILEKDRIIIIHKVSQSLNVKEMKLNFERVIQNLQSIKLISNEKGLLVTESYLRLMLQKSKEWNFLNEKQIRKLSQPYKIEKMNENHQQTGSLANLFYVWQDIFQQAIKQIVKKISNPRQLSINFRSKSQLLLQTDCPRYELKIYDPYGNRQKNRNSLDTAKIFLKVIKFILQLMNDKKNNLKEQALITYCNKSILDFLKIFYQQKVLSQKKQQKCLYDSFMIFNELFDTFYHIKNLQNKDSPFFENNKLMDKYLCDIPIIKNIFLRDLSKVFILQLYQDLEKVEKGQKIQLEKLSLPIKKIKQLLQEEHLSEILQKRRLLTAIEQYEKALFEQKLQKYSQQNDKKIPFMLEQIKKGNDLVENKKLMIELVKSLFSYFQENKVTDIDLQLKILLMNLLGTELKQSKFVIRIYEKQFSEILRNRSKSSSKLSQKEQQFVGFFIDYLIKFGLLQKARQKALLVAQIDQDFSRSLLLKCLMKKNHKNQILFLTNKITPEKKQQLNELFAKTVNSIESNFRKIFLLNQKTNNQIGGQLIEI